MVDLYPPKTSPDNKSYPKWLEEYAKRLLEAPINGHPNFDKDGRFCDRMKINTEGRTVVMLAGSFGGDYDRKFNISPDTDILVCPGFKNDTHAEDADIAPNDDDSIKKRAEEGVDYIVNRYLTVDGTKIENLDDYLVETGLFKVAFPQYNVYGVTPGDTACIAKGWVVMLKPLSENKEHTIYFGIRADINPKSVIAAQLNSTIFEMNIRYTLNVIPPIL